MIPRVDRLQAELPPPSDGEMPTWLNSTSGFAKAGSS
jgi:hypothetical protein